MQTYTYRVYVSDALYWHGQNKTLNKRWVELIEKKPVDMRTPEEIAADIIKRAGLVLRDGDIEDEPVRTGGEADA